jgi:hypothetical protein
MFQIQGRSLSGAKQTQSQEEWGEEKVGGRGAGSQQGPYFGRSREEHHPMENIVEDLVAHGKAMFMGWVRPPHHHRFRH